MRQLFKMEGGWGMLLPSGSCEGAEGCGILGLGCVAELSWGGREREVRAGLCMEQVPPLFWEAGGLILCSEG